jgi:hypothetical protein
MEKRFRVCLIDPAQEHRDVAYCGVGVHLFHREPVPDEVYRDQLKGLACESGDYCEGCLRAAVDQTFSAGEAELLGEYFAREYPGVAFCSSPVDGWEGDEMGVDLIPMGGPGGFLDFDEHVPPPPVSVRGHYCVEGLDYKPTERSLADELCLVLDRLNGFDEQNRKKAELLASKLVKL